MQLDRKGPDPLFRQIEAGLTYEIVTGKRPSGARLPSLRDAALDWGVNLHTVRRAYGELEEQGLVETGAGGTRVVPLGPDAGSGDSLDAHIREFARDARERFGATPSALGRAFDSLERGDGSRAGPFVLVECSRTLSRSLSRDLEDRFAVEVHAFDLLGGEPLPGSPVIGTYFHADELRDLMPGRSHDLSLVRIRPRIASMASLARAVGAGGIDRVILIDRLSRSAEDLAGEFQLFLGPAVAVEVRILRDPLAAFPEPTDRTVVVATPQTWDRLPPEVRARQDVRQLEYEIEPADLERLAKTNQWSSRRHRTRVGRCCSS